MFSTLWASFSHDRILLGLHELCFDPFPYQSLFMRDMCFPHTNEMSGPYPNV